MESIQDESTFQEILDQSGYGAAIVAMDGHWLRTNAYLCEMLGYAEEELMTMTFRDVTLPEDMLSETPYLDRLIAGEIDHYRFKKRYLHKDGRIVWGLLDRSIARDADQVPLYFISHIRDITAEKLAEPKPTLFSRVTSRLQTLLPRR